MLWFSIVASIVLTIALNLFLFLFPGAARRIGDWFARLGEDAMHEPGLTQNRRMRVIFPWKAMLIGSLLLTLAINLLLLLAR